MKRQLTYFYDYNCPYCYLSCVMIDKIRAEADYEVELVAWKMPDNAVVDPKPPGYKEAGMNFATDLAHKLEVSVNFDSPVTGTRAAQEATKVASMMAKGLSYARAVFDLKWVYGQDISDRELLVETAGKLGLDVDAFRSAFLNRQGKQAVEDDFQRAYDKKIWTIPAFLSDQREIQIHHFKDLPSLDQLRNFIMGESSLDEK